ncbi:MAG: dihydrolipoyl dehydrogenase family protein [Fusobacteriaceae bacterium]
MTEYDVIVIGGGATGLTVSIGCAKVGKKVLLIEKKKLGGECTWSGCVPSKSFINLSKKMGKTLDNKNEIFSMVNQKVLEVSGHENIAEMNKLGIDVLIGEVKFSGLKKIIYNDIEYFAENIVICTGSSPSIPNIKGLDNIKYLTNENFFIQKNLPNSLVFIGGGVISVELSLPLAILGVKVSILEQSPIFLSSEDSINSDSILKSLTDNNIDVFLGCEILEIENIKNISRINFNHNKIKKYIDTEKVFLSTGRKSNLEGLNLEKTSLSPVKGRLEINKFLETPIKKIFAGGDILPSYRFSHIAGYHGEIIVRNILFPYLKKAINYKSVPFVIFSDPEYSRLGMSEKEAKSKYGNKLKIYELTTNERTIIQLENSFIIKVFCYNNNIVGATCLGQRAGEIINILQTLSCLKIPFYKYFYTLQAYPTYGDMLRKLSKKAYLDYINSFLIIKFIYAIKKRLKNSLL